jgi:uncharacterized protein (TIGR02147 family)
MIRPNVFQFDDPLVFLKAFFNSLKVQEPELTIRRWAVRMGLSSPKPLVSIFQGKRGLTLKDLEFILRGLDLLPAEARYFEALVLMKKLKTPQEKRVLENLLHFKREAQTPVSRSSSDQKKIAFESTDDELFSHWVDAAVISALRLKSARSDLSLLRKHLLWETDRTQVDRSLEKIRRLGLLDDRQDKPKYSSVTTRSDRPHSGARSYFAQINQIATEAIELPLDEREYQCFSIPARKAETPAFKQMVRRFRDEIASFSAEDGDIVLQFNLEMFPLMSPIQMETPASVVGERNSQKGGQPTGGIRG